MIKEKTKQKNIGQLLSLESLANGEREEYKDSWEAASSSFSKWLVVSFIKVRFEFTFSSQQSIPSQYWKLLTALNFAICLEVLFMLFEEGAF